jgi:hypothetical protein
MTEKQNTAELFQRSHPMGPSGLSEVEQLARRVESKRENRMSVTFGVRKRFLKTCRKIANETGNKSRISLDSLIKLRDETKEEVESQTYTRLCEFGELIGFPNESKILLEVLEKGIERVTIEVKGGYFYFQDFSFYYTKLKSWWPWLNHTAAVYVLITSSYYICTPIFFCYIISDDNVCPTDGKYSGWLTGLYFASTTMSTVGYGDVSVIGDDTPPPRWRVFIGILYMIVSLIVLVTAFNSAVGAAENPLDKLQEIGIALFGGDKSSSDTFLYQRIRRVKAVKLSIIAIEFFTLNLLGVFAARFFVNASDVEEEQWTWMTTLYWSVQTTTTIGVSIEQPLSMFFLGFLLPFHFIFRSMVTYRCLMTCVGSKSSIW